MLDSTGHVDDTANGAAVSTSDTRLTRVPKRLLTAGETALALAVLTALVGAVVASVLAVTGPLGALVLGFAGAVGVATALPVLVVESVAAVVGH